MLSSSSEMQREECFDNEVILLISLDLGALICDSVGCLTERWLLMVFLANVLLIVITGGTRTGATYAARTSCS
jgi:hypothetical protein